MKNPIVVSPESRSLPVISIGEEAESGKREMLSHAGQITAILIPPTRDRAIGIAAHIKGHLKEVEAYRKQIKEPFLETGRRIDKAAKDHVTELESELTRLNRLVGEFNHQQEQARLEAEMALERARKEKEELDSQPEVKPEIRASALSAILDAEEMAQDSVPAAKGGANRKDWEITVTNIEILRVAYPHCVKMTPDLLSIKDLLKKGAEVPGIRAREIHSYNARGVSNRKELI